MEENEKVEWTFWNIAAVVVCVLYGIGIVYVGWQNGVKILKLEKQLAETKTAEIMEDNKELAAELTRYKIFYDACQEVNKSQWDALFLWRSGYLTTRSEDYHNLDLEFELGIARQIQTDPHDFEEEFKIINSLDEKEETIQACLKERHEYMKGWEECEERVYKCLHTEEDIFVKDEEFVTLYHIVRDAVMIKDNAAK